MHAYTGPAVEDGQVAGSGCWREPVAAALAPSRVLVAGSIECPVVGNGRAFSAARRASSSLPLL